VSCQFRLSRTRNCPAAVPPADRLPGHFNGEALAITYRTGAESDCVAWAPVLGRQPWRP
jgi:hypothetical protein